MFRLVAIITVTLVLVGCPALECGEGTHKENNACVANIPYKCGPGTVYEKGYCVIDGYDAAVKDTPDSDEDRDGED
ncbi:MAG TPA: hypothetical protein EYN06_08380 [Myxococcales bacterium]|nr:hypothetical protein [Myxococcales bacterium]HIN86483.1 hypothetical protein [Myxococcales bacterium]